MTNSLTEGCCVRACEPCIARALNIFLVVAFCLFGLGLHAEESMPPLSGFVHRAWTARDGAPGDVFGFAQTNDGMLWVASAAGLFQFDGIRFTPVRKKPNGTLSPDNAFVLYAPPTGGLWAGLRYGGFVFLKDGEITEYPPNDVIPATTVDAVVQDRTGVVWAATSAGLLRFYDGRWESLGREWSLPHLPIATLFVDKSGALWVCEGKALYVLEGGAHQFTKDPVDLSVSYAVRLGTIDDGPDGAVWFADAVRGPRPSRVGRTVLVPNATALQFDLNGALWYSSDNDVRRLTNALEVVDEGAAAHVERFDHGDGLSGTTVNILFRDRDGDIWVGTDEGIDLFAPARLQIVHPGSPGFAMTVAHDGSLWWAETDENTATSTVTHFVNDAIVQQIKVADLINCAYTDAEGTLWFAGTNNVWRFDGKQLNIVPPANSFRGFDTQAMVRARDGSLWRSVIRQGVFKYVDGAWQRGGGLAELPQEPAIVMNADQSGRLWFGYTNNRLAMIDGNSVRMFGPADGIDIGNVTAIETGASTIWVGGSQGLVRFYGDRFVPVIVSGENPFRNLWGLVETRAGELWAAGGRLLIRLDRSQRDEVLRNRIPAEPPRLFDYRDGLAGQVQNLRPLPALRETGNGRVWVALSSGIGFIDPATISSETAPSSVLIRSVSAGGHDYSPYSREIELPKHTSQLRINYTAINFAAPERIRFRYMLEGVDKDWQQVGEQREAIYTNLRPGTYRFQISAANRDSPWSAPGANLEVRIPPAFYQTIWFEACIALAGALFLLFLYRVRMHQVSLQVQSRLEERIAERERIARELHDTLLQGFQGLMLHLQAVAYRVKSEPANAHNLIEQTLKRADTVLEEGRDRVQDLRAVGVASIDLSQIFLQVVDDAQPHPTKVRVTIEGASRELHPIVREEVERIGTEAIANALQHANASEIEVNIAFQRWRFQLRINDDGAGIDPAFLDGGRERHFGLKGMRERARKIRATLSIASRPGGGTGIELVIPASVAYVPRRGSAASFWQRWRTISRT